MVTAVLRPVDPNPRFTYPPYIALAISFFLFTSFSALAARQERLINTWRPTHYDVAITLNRQLSKISARADIDVVAVKNLSVIDLDFSDLATDSVSINNTPTPFVHRNGKLQIALAETVAAGTRLKVTVVYHGAPKDGLILTADKDGKPSAVGDNWPDRVHYWIPSFDHPSAKATIVFRITAANNLIAVANGQLNNVETTGGGMKTWTYSEGVPIPPYCMIIGVGEFAELAPRVQPRSPLSIYVPGSDSAFALKAFSPAGPALEFFSQLIGPYPYEKLALIVGATRFGGMENSSAIVFPSTFLDQDSKATIEPTFGISSNTEEVLAHEIAHQWFGDSVTESTWSDFWLSEGFATYFAALFVQKHIGEAAFQQYMQKAAETALAYEAKSVKPLHDRDTEDLFKLLNGNNYQKGAWVLHMLRMRLGDEAFFRGIRTYYQKHKDSTATSEDLRAALERESGQSLRRFFDRWVYHSGHPQYDLSWKWLPGQRSVRLWLKQTQSSEAFLDSVPIVIKTSDDEIKNLITPTSKSFTRMIKTKQPPKTIEVDPQGTLFKELKIKPSDANNP